MQADVVLMGQSALLGAWLLTSMVIDFVAIPSVFRALGAIENGVLVGGAIGTRVFGIFNWLELTLGLLFVGALLFMRPVKRKIPLMAMGLVLLGIAITYCAYLTPTMTSAFAGMQAAELGEAAQSYSRDKHALLHQVYIVLDSVKMLLLASLLGLLFAETQRGEA